MKRLFPFVIKLFALSLIFVGSCSKEEIKVYELTTEVTPDEGGTISPAQGAFTSGEQITLSAISSNGYFFKNWGGSISGTRNPITFTINSDTKVIAVFAEDDEDGDGVSDILDQCPRTPNGETVNTDGCSDTQTDSDGDSVNDDIDLCTDTPVGETVDEDGCSNSQKDTDNDGVTDDLDQCQNTPSGETVDAVGCSDTQTDSDGDTITDELDQCPNTPEGETVDANGCSDSQKDTDSDGVTDDQDQCPGTPSGETVNVNGCSATQNDSDSDGVNDVADQCPGTASGETVDVNGCSDSQKDTDGDGVTDDLDQCPGTPSGETVDANGCSDSQKDTDFDGVTDDLDQCPGTPSGETVDINGCSDSQKDTDGDGVTDDIDQCPNTPLGETVDAVGCPITGGSSITFATIGDFGSGSLNEANVANLVASFAPDIVITAGDNRYGSLTMDQTVGQFYCVYLDNVSVGPNCSGGNSAANRFFPSPGNHDYSDGGGITEYLNYFDLPGSNITSSNTSNSELYYDFVVGPVHFFTIDSYATINNPTEESLQQNWLQAQLAASTSRWKIVFFHHAPYSSSSLHGSDPNMQWPFAAWGADVVIAGHDHTYERLEQDGIPYFVNGLGGRSIYAFGTPVSGSQVRYNADYGAMIGEATDTSLIFQFINVQGDTIDTYVVQ